MTDLDVPDSIARSLRIDASVDTVWSLVSEPGWWINAGAITPHEIRDAGDHVVVVDPEHGEFRIRTVSVDAPRAVRYEWLDDDGVTTVDFSLTPDGDGVRLTVVESGFAGLRVGPERRAAWYRDNDEGWVTELEAARRHCDARTTSPSDAGR